MEPLSSFSMGDALGGPWEAWEDVWTARTQLLMLYNFIHCQLPNFSVEHPNTHNNKLATYHSWFATPFSRNERMPTIVPQYLHLDLSKHVMRNVNRFRLQAHTLKVEAAAWLEDKS
jgi:hypothetical protein